MERFLEHNWGYNCVQQLIIKQAAMINGYLIAPDCPYWHLYKLLRQIIDLTMSPIFSVDATYYLESVVSDHHQHFKQLFPNKNITPKHFLCCTMGKLSDIVGLLIIFGACDLSPNTNKPRRWASSRTIFETMHWQWLHNIVSLYFLVKNKITYFLQPVLNSLQMESIVVNSVTVDKCLSLGV